jgi:dTDP-4-dehydrorhamnose 3,5-epimerase
MNVLATPLQGVVVLEPKVFGDQRGFFMETYHHDRFKAAGITASFVQDNWSRSRKGTLRGLHYQLTQPQGKLVMVGRGEVFDVAVDMRRSSPTFGKWFGATLSEENHLAMYVPPGFAHGFCVLSDEVDFFYKCTDFYNPADEQVLLWNDPGLGIDWPLSGEPLLSAKDIQGKALATAATYP